ncbi:uncharacterized protein LOC108680438 isoform X2 [Hyalella azteca]|uniref:Uncharacterized protein LOC108680438 isoform X1 n=1 Tax=Hyalella azteca TaxID=294128 RepID=A0A8B7PGQ3_HYAAZ|nr:uncharacterized protein LOC108680438 isoform X1 [Hyalella azteca]XP_018024747.1 uncharacterized protein LOC108680438 isoform X2 [Hyalella azteca]
MTDTDGINTTYVATDAPFGFGYAVLIESVKKQCLKQNNFTSQSGTACMADPNLCPNGLSFSIWEKHTFSEDEFLRYDRLKDSDIKYVLSTGGDREGHPGIAFFHHGIFQHAIVSTGDKYWEVKVPGLMYNATWANIGIRWSPNVTMNPNDVPIKGGLELFITTKRENPLETPQKRVGQSFFPLPSTKSKQAGLNPPELMLGCHKTSDNATYRYFGDGEYDELASWRKPLPENETSYFLGGYMDDFANADIKDTLRILNGADMSNPDQLAIAMKAADQMSQVHAKPTSAPETTAAQSTNLASSSPTPAGPNRVDALTEEESMDRREQLLDLANKVYNVSNLPASLTFETANSLLNLKLASNLMSRESAGDWEKIQMNGSGGAAILMWNVISFSKEVFCRIRYDNNTKPFTKAQATENIIFYGQKMLYADLKSKGRYVQLPDYGDPQLRDAKTNWNIVYDAARFSTKVLNDNNCNKRPVCLVTMVFNTYDDIGPTPINFANIPRSSTHEMGSRLVYGSMSADIARDARWNVNTSAPLCYVDPFSMSDDPFYVKLENNDDVPSLRQLNFHSEEVVTQIETRRCAFWNANLSDFGAWDTDGCNVVEDTAFYTRCSCDKFGPMIVLAEQVDPAVVPPQQDWLKIVKLIFYAISAVLLILYSVVVVYSPDLKEQFHLMGVNLSISVLLGSIAMIVSDFDGIRNDRHLCTTISTLTHFFYVAAGAWVACLGYASFKAITSGEVGGKLNSYSCISWGLSLVSVGVPYAFFVRDLGTDPRCFVTWENYGKAAFFIPQMAYVVIAFFCGFVVLCNLSTPALRKENLIDDYGSFCRGAAFIMLYFAITWTFGLLAYMRFDLTIDFFPVFQILNSLTGIIIFICIGVGSYRYRTVLVGQAKTRREKIKNLAGIKKTKLEDDMPAKPQPRTQFKPATTLPDRPLTTSSLRPPAPRGNVAGRPGSRPVTPS